VEYSTLQLASLLWKLMCHVGSHSVLPAIRQSWHSHPYPSWSWYSIKQPKRMQGWVDLVGWLHAETVYPPQDSHLYWHWIGPTLDNFVDMPNDAASMPHHHAHAVRSVCNIEKQLFSGLFPGQPWHASTKRSFWILMRQGMMSFWDGFDIGRTIHKQSVPCSKEIAMLK